jgi:hypothetical protein
VVIHRRTFLQGAAASLAAARLGSAFAQDSVPPQRGKEPTTIYNNYYKQMEAERFDPLTAPAELLDRYGLPRLPEPSSPLYDFLRELLAPPLQFAEPMIQFPIVPATYTSQRFQRGPVVSGSFESSRNWSGAYIQPNHGNSFTDVAGIWKIPAISMPGGPAGSLPPASSVWVGLDGQRRYFDSILPQIGTRQEFDASGVANYWAWYQCWMRDQPTTYTPTQVPILVTSNDIVFGWVQVQSPIVAVVAMAKLNPPFAFWAWPIPAPHSPNGRQARISGATAEWVVERPSPTLFPDLLNPLPKYDPIVFSACITRAAPTTNAPNGVFENLDGARFIQMFDRKDSPARTIGLAKSERIGLAPRRTFRVDYVGP